MRELAALLTAALLLTACGGNEGHTLTAGNVTIVDAIDLVRAVHVADPPTVDRTPTAVRGGGLDQLILVWDGSSCTKSWKVRISGNAISAVITPTAACVPSNPEPERFAVALDLTRAVDAERIDVRLEDSPS